MPVIARSGSVEPFALRTETPKALLTLRSRGQRLVAETGADGDLVAALGATAAEHSGAGLGLHAGKKAVGLGPVAAIGLKSTLRHGKKLLRQETTPAQTFGDSSNLRVYPIEPDFPSQI